MSNIVGYSDTVGVTGSSLKGEEVTTAVAQIEIFNPERVTETINSSSRAIYEIEKSINNIKNDIVVVDAGNKELYHNLGLINNRLDKNTDNVNSAKSYIGEIIAANRKELNSMNWSRKIIHFRKVKHLQTYINTLMVVKEALNMLTTHQ